MTRQRAPPAAARAVVDGATHYTARCGRRTSSDAVAAAISRAMVRHGEAAPKTATRAAAETTTQRDNNALWRTTAAAGGADGGAGRSNGRHDGAAAQRRACDLRWRDFDVGAVNNAMALSD
ncbi:hypothetical protein Scep_014624 [Stephania cephalantha]|uniref:Uncharacterized protein n=1 Tax=Stephania cephalantha TaxID=152367 RepID=A0AAP0J3I0_9MAGN